MKSAAIVLLLTAASMLPAISHAVEPDQAAEAFGKLDVNEDGRLSGTEVTDQVRPFDADQDGRVTREEYLAATAKPSKEAAEKQFQERDINQDGVLSGTERRGLEKADADSDGEVTKQEFLAAAAPSAGGPSRSGPSREALYAKAKELFAELDATKDYRLSGTELDTVKSYDLNSDGRMYLDEFFEGYERAQGAGWTNVEFREASLNVKLPAKPERLPVADPMKVRAALEIERPDIRFEVRVSEVKANVEAQADQFFTAVKDRLKTVSQMEILDEDDAPYSGHPGRVLFLKGKQNDFHVIRIVLLEKSIYELEAIFNKLPGNMEKSYTRRFLENLSIVGQVEAPTSDVPAPPGTSSTKGLPRLPGGPAARERANPLSSDDDVPAPPAPISKPAVPPAPNSDPVPPPAPISDPKPAAPSPPAPPRVSEGPLSPRRGIFSLSRTRPSQTDGTAKPAEPAPAPPSDK